MGPTEAVNLKVYKANLTRDGTTALNDHIPLIKGRMICSFPAKI